MLSQGRLAEMRDVLRGDFPGLDNDEVMFENAGGTFVPTQVTERVAAHFRECNVQRGGAYGSSLAVEEVLTECSAFVHEYMGCGTVGYPLLGTSARSLVSTLSERIFDAILRNQSPVHIPIIISAMNHMTHIRPWIALHERLNSIKNANIRSTLHTLSEIDRSEPGFFSHTELSTTLSACYDGSTPTAPIVIIPHVSNLVGEVIDVKRIVSEVRRHNAARVLIDGVAYASSGTVDCAELCPDWYSMSLYKNCCPQSGVLFGTHQAWGWVCPNGESDTNVFEMVSGHTNYATASGILGFESYLQKVVTLADNLPEVEVKRMGTRAMVVRALSVMKQMVDDVVRPFRLWVAQNGRLKLVRSGVAHGAHTKPIVSFTSHSMKSADIATGLIKAGIACKSGSLMSPGASKALGIDTTDGVVRISAAHYNTPAEIAYVMKVLDDVVPEKAKL